MGIRKAIKIGLTTLVLGTLGTVGWGVGKVTNGCNYNLTKGTLKVPLLGKPTCKEAKNKLKTLKSDDTFPLWRYWRGDYGGIKAYKEYIKNECP